jgi:hypothetical protein
MSEPSDLYGLALEQFIPERGAMAKSLRAEGQRDEAARVAKLAKPSVAAWAVNQLVRTQGKSVSDLFDAGDALIEAQSAVLDGRGDALALREAGQRERAAVDELSAAARGLLGSSGNEMSPATLDRVSETLHAAALDDDARAQVRGGCLVRELQHIGLGGASLGAGSGGAGSRGAGSRGAPAPAPRGAERAASREHTARVKAAEKAEAAARRQADRAARDLKAAEERRGRAAAALSEAEEALAAAQARARATRREHDDAVQVAEAARRGRV